MSYSDDDNRIRRRKVSSSTTSTKSSRENNAPRENREVSNVNNNRYKDSKRNQSYKTENTRSKSKARKKKEKKRKLLKGLLVTILVGLIVLSTVGSIFVFAAMKDTTAVNSQVLEANYISSSVATSEEIPKYLKDAVVSIEDERFYNHKGVDIISLGRSVVHNLLSDTTQGGSTIEMQISKNLLTSDDRTMKRKIKDIYYATQMDKFMTKDEILCTYLNNVYFGKSAYGVGKASKVYFGKNVQDLTLAQSAMLVGITNNPAKYKEHREAKKRQEVILYKMKELGYIDEEEYSQAISEKVPFKSEIE